MGKAKTFRSYDGILIWVTCTAVSAFVLATLVIFANSFAPSPSSLMISTAVSIAVLAGAATACAMAMLFATDLWVLMGNASLTRRLIVAFAVNGILAVFVVAGASFGFMRMNSEGIIDVFFGITTQRLLVLTVLGATGFCLQHVCRWRITGPFGKGTQRSRFQTSIGDLLVGTAMIAGMLGCLTYWSQQSDLPPFPRHRSDELLQMLVGISVIELVAVLCYLLLPLLLAYSSPLIRRRYPSVVALWICFCGAIAALLTLAYFGGTNIADALIIAGFVLVGHVLFAAGMLVVLWLLTGVGYQMLTGANQIEREIRPPRPIVRFGCVAALVLTALFYALVDIPTLFETGSLSCARRVAWMTRVQGRFPNGIAAWFGQEMRFSNPSFFQFSGDQDALANMLRKTIVPSDGTVNVGIRAKDVVSRKVLSELQRKSIEHLTITCPDLDSQAFDEFCRSSDVSFITIGSPELTAAHFYSLHQLANLHNVELIQPLRYTSEIGTALKGLPFESLTIRLHRGRLDDVSGLTGVEQLTIRNSAVSSKVIEQLSQLRLKRLVLDACELDRPSTKSLSKMKLDVLEWSNRDANDPAGDEILLQLADATEIGRLQIESPFDDIFVTKFQNRAKFNPENQIVGSGRYREQLDDESPPTLFDVLYQEREGDVDAALEKMATELVRNEAGQIEELDLQEMPLRDLKLDELPQLKSLRRLRLGHANQSRNLFARVGRLESLRELEISGHGFDNEALANVCRLKDLKRLQLPLCPAMDAGLMRRPERIPIADETQLGFMEVEWLAELLSSPMSSRILLLNDIHAELGTYGDGYGGYGYGYGNVLDFPMGSDADNAPMHKVVAPDGFKSILKLERLEYLFLPGYLLSAETLESIAQLNGLKELHAVFSMVDSDLLDRVTELRQLEALSIGVAGIDRNTVPSLARLKKLRVLQLVVFDFQSHTLAQRKAINASLKAALPDCELHVIFFPAAGSYGSGQGGMF